ncbi:MAG: hypothetical protein QM610_15765 [Chitinophagaceae bacterium]
MRLLWLTRAEYGKQSNYAGSILETLQQQGFEVVSFSDNAKQHTDKKNLIVVISTRQQSKLRTWLDNTLRYAPLLNKWQIEKIVLPDFFVKIESNLPQYSIVSRQHFSLKEEEKTFIQKHPFSFITYDSKIKEKITDIFPNKPVVVYNSNISSLFQPLDWDVALEVKEKYSDGEDYFLANSIGQSVEDSVAVLKGFSIFKKWQKSGMKILFLTDHVQQLQDKIANYKYREDVRLINQPDEKERSPIVAGAYCTIHLSDEDGDNAFVLESAQCHIPVLLKKESTASAWLDNNSFHIDDVSTETLGQAFITMYKAENVRSRHVSYMEQHPLTAPSDGLDILIN